MAGLVTSVSKRVSLAGKDFSLNLSLQTPGALVKEVSVPSSFQGALTTRTSATAGVVTIPGNQVSNGARISIYWVGGFVQGAIVSSVVGNAVTFAGAVGTALPAQGTTVFVAVEQELSLAFSGDTISAVTCFTERFGMFNFVLGNGNSALSSAVVAGGVLALDSGYEWDWIVPATAGAGYVNPLAGQSVVNVWVSHMDNVQARIMRVGVALPN